MKLARGTVAVFAAAAVLTVAAPSVSAESPAGVSWQSAGDSYSSGEGVWGNEGACAQSDAAYGPAAARLLRNEYGWDIPSETFTACTEHLVEDFFHARGDSGGKGSLWQWGRDQGAPERLDVIALSFGGNDIGFGDVILDCIVGVADHWTDYLPTSPTPAGVASGIGRGTAGSFSGCDVSAEDLNRRADHLLDPPRRGCTTNRRADKAYDCDIAIEGRRGSIIDFYYDVVSNQLTDRGRLYVVGYPRMFADVDQWPRWSPAACSGVLRGDTQKLGSAAEHLNNKLQEAVRRANEALGEDSVVFVDRFAFFRDGQHELCGRGEDWLNGLSRDRGDWSLRPETSFHPNEAGHAGVAAELARIVDETFSGSCGTVISAIGRPIAVHPEGDVGCAEALEVADRYYNDPTLTAVGSSGYADVGEWGCASTSCGVTEMTGEAGSCHRDSDGAVIKLRVP